KEEPLPPIEPAKPPTAFESTNMENIRAKMDLILTQVDSMRVQNETLSERIKNVERISQEILRIAKAEAR
ncbi:MAG TPA: hypothetical protein VJ343_01185, partial [archaeon]|nr:hypothetical protein [archaeon]